MNFIGCNCAVIIVALSCTPLAADERSDLHAKAEATAKHAATFYWQKVASHGGYVYFYSLDLQQRWGEGVASEHQIWVQPPGTPTVGLAYVSAFEATGDRFYLDAATAAAEALVYGQLRSGGWTNCIDFDPRGQRVALYRNGKGGGRNTSSLDDGQTQTAIKLLMRVDEAHQFQHAKIHGAAQIALDALLHAQFPNGAFPQVWDDRELPDPPAMPASYPDYEWRSEGRIKNYWDMYTLNDNVTGYVADTLMEAHRIYDDPRYLSALEKLGDFLLQAQMPEPQPGWAQQYNYQMQPIWARKFEPPGIGGDESQEVIDTLMRIARVTGEQRYVEPIPRALAYLRRSELSDGKLARYYELKTNTPLYMVRSGDVYTLTYDDSNLPAHYSWKGRSRVAQLQRQYDQLKRGEVTAPRVATPDKIRQIITDLDSRGRWVSRYDGERLVGQAKMAEGTSYLSSERFSENLTALSEFLKNTP